MMTNPGTMTGATIVANQPIATGATDATVAAIAPSPSATTVTDGMSVTVAAAAMARVATAGRRVNVATKVPGTVETAGTIAMDAGIQRIATIDHSTVSILNGAIYTSYCTEVYGQ